MPGDVELIPEGFKRCASCEEHDDECNAEDADGDDVNPGRDPETSGYRARVEAAVEKEDGDLDHSTRHNVQEVEDEGYLALRDVHVWMDVPDVAIEVVLFGCWISLLGSLLNEFVCYS